MAENYAPLPDEWLEEMEELADAEYGRLIRWYQEMKIHGTAEKLCGNERFYTKRCLNTLARFREAGEKRVEDARAAANKRWGKGATACEGIREHATESDPMPNDATNTSTNTSTSTSTNNKDVALDAHAHVNRPIGKVMAYYMDRINATPSSTTVAAIQGYLDTLDAPVVVHAMEIAVDEKKTAWSYINAILQRYVKDGTTTMEAVLAAEQRFRDQKADRPHSKDKRPYGTSGESRDDTRAMEQIRRLREKIRQE